MSEEVTGNAREAFTAAWERDKGRPLRIYPPLPRKVRLHLRLHHQVNGLGIWLCDHRCWRLACVLWGIKPWA